VSIFAWPVPYKFNSTTMSVSLVFLDTLIIFILQSQLSYFEDEDILVNPTAVRVPVIYGHSEAINIETKKKITATEATEILSNDLKMPRQCQYLPGLCHINLTLQQCRFRWFF
jgi:methylaspartate ammonia-lyase